MSRLAKQTAPPVLVWDYSAIEHEAPTEIIQAAAGQIKLVFRRTLENIIEIGKLLHVVRENIPHGSWGDWLDVEIGMSLSSASNYLRAYEHAADFRAVENWSAGAAFLLVGCDEAVETANQMAESGQKVTKAEAAEILHGPTDPTSPSGESQHDPAETQRDEPAAAHEIDHDQDRTRLAPEPGDAASDSGAALKLARAAWVNLARLADLNEAGAMIVAREAWHELKASGELTLGDNGKPCDQTLKSFLAGARDE